MCPSVIDLTLCYVGLQYRTQFMSKASETRVPCSRETREELRSAKRGGESFDQLFQKMLEQYEPDIIID